MVKLRVVREIQAYRGPKILDLEKAGHRCFKLAGFPSSSVLKEDHNAQVNTQVRLRRFAAPIKDLGAIFDDLGYDTLLFHKSTNSKGFYLSVSVTKGLLTQQLEGTWLVTYSGLPGNWATGISIAADETQSFPFAVSQISGRILHERQSTPHRSGLPDF